MRLQNPGFSPECGMASLTYSLRFMGDEEIMYLLSLTHTLKELAGYGTGCI